MAADFVVDEGPVARRGFAEQGLFLTVAKEGLVRASIVPVVRDALPEGLEDGIRHGAKISCPHPRMASIEPAGRSEAW